MYVQEDEFFVGTFSTIGADSARMSLDQGILGEDINSQEEFTPQRLESVMDRYHRE